MAADDRTDLAELAAQVLALRTVVRLLVGQALGQDPAGLKEVRDAATQTIANSLAQMRTGGDPSDFERSVQQAILGLLADMPAGVGYPGR